MPSFIGKQTTLDLNGPVLSFVQHPEPASSCTSGIATFVGLATATFPTQDPANPATGTGYISYNWYLNDEALVDGDLNGTTVTGAATTTLTLSGISSAILLNGSRVFLRADYIPSAYSQPEGSDVNAGTARSTGNAINDPKDSDFATLSVYPNIVVNSHPSPGIATAAQGSSVTFSVDASTTDLSQGNVSYQWQLNEVDLIDGENTISIPNNNQDYPYNAVLRLPLWDKNSGSLVLEDLTNVANTVTNNRVTWVSGAGGKFYNGYANFTSESYIDLSPTSDFNFGTGDFTVETWVYFTETGWKDIFSTGTYGQNQLSIRKNSASQLPSSPGSEQLEVYYGTTIIASGGQFSLNTWHHVAVTRTTPQTNSKQDSILRLFIDGVQVASAVFNDNIRATDVKIGRTPGNVYNMVGRIQDFQVYAISKYTSNFTPSTVAIVDKRIVLSLPLWDNGTGELSLTDLSANTKTITSGSSWGRSPTWKTGVGKFYGGAAFFGGRSYLNVAGSSDFNFGTGDFTIECWVNFQSGSNPYPTGPWEVLVNVGGGYYSDGGTWFAFLRNGTGGATFYIANVSGYASIGTVSDLKLGTWRHLAVSKEGTNVRFYVDGQYVGQRVDSAAYGGNNLGYIALEHATFHDQGYYFPFAYMQDINIYKGVAKYTSNFTPTATSIVSGLSESVEVNTTVSGAQTSELTLDLPNVSKNLIRAKVSHPTACNSPVYTNTAQFDVVSPAQRAVIEVEAYSPDSATATLREFDLTNLDYVITNDDFDSDTICFYAKDRDLSIEFEMYGAKGSDLKVYFGGEGGYSKIRFTMRKGEEYILKGIKTKTALYLYRKSQLIACVAQGGSAGTNGNGGRGGGIGVSGENGFGKNSGNGGIAIASGTMSGNGIFGSSSGATSIYSEDSKSTGITGGRTISCAKGVYWRDRGISACSDLGTIKFRLADGTEVSNSASITRGFKDGYAINQTSGNSQFTGGVGGNGATGGDGGINGGGGGGGSGYTDGSVTVVDTTLGGHNVQETKLIMRLFETVGDFYIDSAGRILIFSAATVGKDPRTLTKTTGRVLPGTDSCIDDARWQNFLDLAETQDYRISATRDGGSTGITEARPFNIRRMKRANSITLKRSLTDWENTNYAYLLLALAWDETNIGGARGYGSDYSIFSMAPGTYNYGFYGASTNSFFNESAGSVYGYGTVNFWILPPGVPDFPR